MRVDTHNVTGVLYVYMYVPLNPLIIDGIKRHSASVHITIYIQNHIQTNQVTVKCFLSFYMAWSQLYIVWLMWFVPRF